MNNGLTTTIYVKSLAEEINYNHKDHYILEKRGSVLKVVWNVGCCISHDLYSIVEMNDGDYKGLDPFVSEIGAWRDPRKYF